METIQFSTTENTTSRSSFITGTAISILCILFLLFDAIMKIIRESHSVSGSTQLGLPDSSVQPLGITLLICTVFYIIPRTKILGAILLTAYLGGATATMVRVGLPIYFSVVFGILVWLGAYLTNKELRNLIPFVKTAK
jgi:hypothetical protein